MADECTGCNDALEELHEFLHGELTDEKRAAIKAHLDDCEPCLDKFDFEHDLREMLKQRCRDQVPQEMRDRIARLINQDA